MNADMKHHAHDMFLFTFSICTLGSVLSLIRLVQKLFDVIKRGQDNEATNQLTCIASLVI